MSPDYAGLSNSAVGSAVLPSWPRARSTIAAICARAYFRKSALALRRVMARIGRDRSGVSAIEFAIIAPVLMTVAVGIAQFGLVLNNYIVLTEAVADGARVFALSRGSSTPLTTTTSAVTSSASTLTTASITVTTSVNGTACTTDSGCSTALTSASGQQATVSATYPCSLTVYGYNYAPSCTLTSSTADIIE